MSPSEFWETSLHELDMARKGFIRKWTGREDASPQEDKRWLGTLKDAVEKSVRQGKNG